MTQGLRPARKAASRARRGPYLGGGLVADCGVGHLTEYEDKKLASIQKDDLKVRVCV